MAHKHILLGISGGIAAYKSCTLVRLLRAQGHDVTVVMTREAGAFVGHSVFQALSGNPVLTDTHEDGSGNGMAHINLSRAADVMLIAPATANTLAKIAGGIADNLLTTLTAARNCPLAVAPAMNVQMWQNPANLRNVELLRGDGIAVFGPEEGDQACGETGPGRMWEADMLADVLPDLWTPKILAGKRILLTAGSTFEAIDPVRGITNLSSGRMGMALARAFRAAGAIVTVVAGGMEADIPPGLAETVRVRDAAAMFDAVQAALPGQDVFVSVAAVADYRVKNRSSRKWKKEDGGDPVIELERNPDILASVAALPTAPFCVGFAAESHDVLSHAREKRRRKNIPLMVANDVGIAMGSDTNRVILLDDFGERELPLMDKTRVAEAVAARLAELLVKQ